MLGNNHGGCCFVTTINVATTASHLLAHRVLTWGSAWSSFPSLSQHANRREARGEVENTLTRTEKEPAPWCYDFTAVVRCGVVVNRLQTCPGWCCASQTRGYTWQTSDWEPVCSVPPRVGAEI